MKTYVCIIILFVMALKLNAQGFKEKSFRKLIGTMVAHSVDEISAKDSDYDSSVVYLDAREKNEFDVSRIKNARWIGYNDFDLERLEGIKKDQKLVVYCSMGVRSEKIAEKIQNNGYNNVANMIGGIFEWANYEKPLIDSTESDTNKVHGFSMTWGIWLDGSKVEKVYD